MKRSLKISIPVALLACLGCTQQMSAIGSNILSSTGFVSSSQADAIFTVGNKLSKATESVSDEQEYYLGRAVAATILEKYALSEKASIDDYTNKVVEILAASSTRPETFAGYHVGILATDQINAVSAPGGFILISRGFLRILDSEDQLAAVIAHEIGHVALKHGLSAISESNLTDAFQIIGKEASSAALQNQAGLNELNNLFGDSINEVVGTILDKGYSRSQEYQADAYAALLLKKAGYNPAALIEVFSKLAATPHQEGGWSSTHPSPDDRKSELSSDAVANNGSPGEGIRRNRFLKTVQH